ncbi:MerR family transcriptional regulator [Actinosynnema sp. NPDC059335]|uniref:MerR family transcriptional regulator n=1 Tax=Actinosynnema sp. NPDC059335 TaxID=3346804 RepID=UPI00367195C5
MSQIRITELAQLTGFAPSAIRFYENSGLLPTASRSAGGRRVYTDRDVDRLRFIARGKQMGLTLDEIRELVLGWDGNTPDAARDLLIGKLRFRISEVNLRIAELSAFSLQLVETLHGFSARDAATDRDHDLPCLRSWMKVLAYPHTYRHGDGVLAATFPSSPSLTVALAELVAHECVCRRPTAVLLRCTPRTTTLELAVDDLEDHLVATLFATRPGTPIEPADLP